MADSANPSAPAGQSGGQSGAIDVAAMIKSVTQQVTQAVSQQIADITKNQQVLADTLAEVQKKAAESPAPAKGITPEEVSKLVAEQLKTRDEAAQKTAGKQALRDKIAKEKLGGDADLAALLPDTDDEAQLAKVADTLAAKVKLAKPDFGGAASTGKDGGTTPNQGQAPALNPNLPAGVAKFAASMKLPA